MNHNEKMQNMFSIHQQFVQTFLELWTWNTSATSFFFKKLGDGQSLKRKLSVNLSRAMCSLLDFLSLEDGTDRLSQTLVRNYHHTLHISEQRRSHTMIWHAGLGLVPHGTVQSDLVWHFIHEFTKTSHIELPNLREKPHFIF